MGVGKKVKEKLKGSSGKPKNEGEEYPKREFIFLSDVNQQECELIKNAEPMELNGKQGCALQLVSYSDDEVLIDGDWDPKTVSGEEIKEIEAGDNETKELLKKLAKKYEEEKEQ